MPPKRKAKLKQTTLLDAVKTSSPRTRASTSQLSARKGKQKSSISKAPVDDDDQDHDVDIGSAKLKPTKVTVDNPVKRRRTALRIDSDSSNEEEAIPVKRKSRRLAVVPSSEDEEPTPVDKAKTRRGTRKSPVLRRKRAKSAETDEGEDSDIADEVEPDRTHILR